MAKKRTWGKKGKKAFYPCGHDANGGPRISAHYIFYFYNNDEHPESMNLNMPKDTKNEEELNKAKESGALTIMLGKNNDVYYYEGQLLPDGSNFKSATFQRYREEIIDKKKEVIKTHVHDAIVAKIIGRKERG